MLYNDLYLSRFQIKNTQNNRIFYLFTCNVGSPRYLFQLPVVSVSYLITYYFVNKINAQVSPNIIITCCLIFNRLKCFAL